MNTTATGRHAEQVAAEYLERHGLEVAARNWRTRCCEIDIVAIQDNVIYFVEVKYRLRSCQGTGLEYITPSKLRQMSFAAQVWVHRYQWNGDFQLAAIEISGPEFKITTFLRDL